jgi:hypothetical protein
LRGKRDKNEIKTNTSFLVFYVGGMLGHNTKKKFKKKRKKKKSWGTSPRG